MRNAPDKMYGFQYASGGWVASPYNDQPNMVEYTRSDIMQTTPKNPGDALAPCPFCGGHAYYNHTDAGPDRKYYRVHCEKCDARIGHPYTGKDAAREAWNTRAALTQKPAGGDAAEWIKAQPAQDYDDLKRQFCSLKSALNSMGEQLSFYSKKSYETGEKHLAELQASLDSERAMNAQLTEELAALTPAPIDVEGLKRDMKLKVKLHCLARNVDNTDKMVDLVIDYLKSSGHLHPPAPVTQEMAKKALDDFKLTRDCWMTSKLKTCTSLETSDTIEAILQHHAGKGEE